MYAELGGYGDPEPLVVARVPSVNVPGCVVKGVRATPCMDETPSMKETPCVHETACVDEAPRVPETLCVRATPCMDETPSVNETQCMEETPCVEWCGHECVGVRASQRTVCKRGRVCVCE